MNIDEMIAVLEAHKRGEKIEFRITGSALWTECDSTPKFNFSVGEYRIAPKPKSKIRLYGTVDLKTGQMFLLKYSGGWDEGSSFVRVPQFDCVVEVEQ